MSKRHCRLLLVLSLPSALLCAFHRLSLQYHSHVLHAATLAAPYAFVVPVKKPCREPRQPAPSPAPLHSCFLSPALFPPSNFSRLSVASSRAAKARVNLYHVAGHATAYGARSHSRCAAQRCASRSRRVGQVPDPRDCPPPPRAHNPNTARQAPRSTCTYTCTYTYTYTYTYTNAYNCNCAATNATCFVPYFYCCGAWRSSDNRLATAACRFIAGSITLFCWCRWSGSLANKHLATADGATCSLICPASGARAAEL